MIKKIHNTGGYCLLAGFCFCVAALCISSFTSMASSLPVAQTIRGKVTDSKNLPLPGVSITVKGNKQGIMTNASSAAVYGTKAASGVVTVLKA